MDGTDEMALWLLSCAMFSKRKVWARPPRRYMTTNFHESGLNAQRATQLPPNTARPVAILTHIVRSALGDIFWSAKNLSRRRRKTFGNVGAPAASPENCRGGASDGTRSSISGFRAIAAWALGVTSTSTIILAGPAHPWPVAPVD